MLNNPSPNPYPLWVRPEGLFSGKMVGMIAANFEEGPTLKDDKHLSLRFDLFVTCVLNERAIA